MKWETLERIVLELKNIDYQGRVHPYGNGEPLTDDKFLDRVMFIRKELPKCYIYMATNGDFINKPHSFKDILDAGVDEIQCDHYDDRNANLKENSPNNVVHYDVGMLRTNFYNRAGNIQLTNITPSARCWFPGKKLYFNYFGDMLICCSDWTFEHEIGNINKESLPELYEKLMNKDREPLCSKCNLINH